MGIRADAWSVEWKGVNSWKRDGSSGEESRATRARGGDAEGRTTGRGHEAPVDALSNETHAEQVEQRGRRTAGRMQALNGGRLSGRNRTEAEEK